MFERPGIKPTTAPPASIMASLSLYLIILAFFIMMNSISQLEGSRTKGVLESINASFKDYPQTTIITLDASDQGAGEKPEPGFEKSIEELFESAFPLASVEIRQGFDEVEVTLPLDSLFSPGGIEIQGRNEAVLDRLAVLLGNEAPGKRREIEALLPWLSSTRGYEPVPGGPLAINRAGSLARELTARGVPAAAIAIGMERRNADTMRFRFITRTINAPDAVADGAS